MSTRHEAPRKRFDGIYVPEGGTIVVVRHGTSEGNSGGRWTGRRDVPLSAPKGFEDAQKVAKYLAGHEIVFDQIYTSTLQRARATARVIEQELLNDPEHPELGFREIPTISTPALDERDFGQYTWWTRDDVTTKVGIEEFNRLRRHWTARIPGDPETGFAEGESMEDVAARVTPVTRGEILPRAASGENILMVVHSNVARITLADFHELPPGQTHETLVVHNGEAHMFEVSTKGEIVDHEVLRDHKVGEHILYHSDHDLRHVPLQ